jgi:hypothetical protein
MATFASGFIRPGVYVKQTTGPGAAQLPSSFISALIGQGSDRFTIFDKTIVSGAGATDVLDSERNGASIVSIRYNNIAITSGFALANVGAVPYGTATVVWTANKPATGKSYVVTYVAYKNPSIDYAVAYLSDITAHLNYYGQPSQSSAAIVNGSSIVNAISMGAAIEKGNGATSWYAAQISPFDESTLGAAAVEGYVSGASGTTGATGSVFTLNLYGDGAQSITVPAGVTGANLASYLQSSVQALVAVNPALQAAYDQFDVDYIGLSNSFTLMAGMAMNAGNVSITGTAIVGGTNHSSTGATMLALTSEAGLYTATQQALTKLELVDAWVLVHCFPIMIGADNASLVPLVKSHVFAMRDIATQKWRVAMVGAKKNTDTGTNPEAKYVNTQLALGDKSLGVVAPSTNKYIYGGVEYVLDGWAIAAAVAGVMTNPIYGAGEPIAGKPLVGFSEIKDVFNTTQKNTMGTAGVLMIDNELGVPAIIMDLTTDQSNNVNSQFKFTRAADYVSKALRIILRKLYINVNNLGDTTLGNIGTSTKLILQQMVWLHIINDFADPIPSRNATDARQVDLVVSIQLVPDVTWIYVNLGVKL